MKQHSLIPLLCAVAAATSVPALAQTRAVSGRVTGADGAGLPGVTVLERGTTNGTSTTADGSFSLTVQPGATLTISSIGFSTQNVVVGSQSTVAVTLREDAVALDEAVVVGYGTQSKQDLTGSVVQLSSRDVGNQPVQSFEQSIQGRAAGVFIENSSGKLGQGVRVRVRGVTSISGETQPLYVVDGIPVLSDNLSSTSAATNPISDINPNDIESISVLKDASAAAIYGSRASNGVVLITTKRGKSGATRFTLGYQTGRSEPTRKREFLNSSEYIELLSEALVNFGSSQASIDRRLTRYAAGQSDFRTNGVDTDWQDEVFQKAPFNQYDFSASGGTEKTKFFFSGQYSDQRGIMVSNRFKRISTRFNLDNQATERLKLGVNVGLTRSVNNRLPNDNAFSNPMQMVALAPITPLIDPRTGLLSGTFDPATGEPDATYPFYYNPLLSVQNGSYVTTSYRILGNVYGQLQLLPGLIYRSELGIDVINQNEEQFLSRVTSRNTGPTNGFGFNTSTVNTRLVVNNYVSLNKTLGEVHTVEATLGTAYEAGQVRANSVTGTQFPSDAFRTVTSAAQITAGSTNRTDNTLVSYFGRANYAYAGKYLLGLSARVDGSSRFGVNNRYGFFPAASIGWVVSEESFLKDNTVLSMVKPRASIGRTGNQGFNNFVSRPLWIAAPYVGIGGQRPFQLGNPDLRWEATTQMDAGLEVGFLNNRIITEVDVYRRRTNGLVLAQPVPATTGYVSLFRNVGDLENRGVEFSLTTRNFEGDFTWTTNFNAAYNRNRITSLDGPPILGQFLNRAEEGQPLGVFVGPEYAGVDPTNGDALYRLNTTNPDGSVDRGTTNDINLATPVPVGDPNPRWTGGLTNTFSFKGLDLTATLVGVQGNKIFDGGAQFYSVGFNNGPDNQTRDQLNRWRQPGDITDVPRAEYISGIGTGFSSRFVRDGSYMRLRTVALGYTLPADLVKRAYLQSARIFVQGLNLATITNYKGWDPEVSTDYITGSINPTSNASQAQSNINQGVDFYTVPQPRTYTVGVNIGF